MVSGAPKVLVSMPESTGLAPVPLVAFAPAVTAVVAVPSSDAETLLLHDARRRLRRAAKDDFIGRENAKIGTAPLVGCGGRGESRYFSMNTNTLTAMDIDGWRRPSSLFALSALLFAPAASAQLPEAVDVPKRPASTNAQGVPVADRPAATGLPWARHLDVGPQLLVSHRAASDSAAGIRFDPGVGFGVGVQWPIHRYVLFDAQVSRIDHAFTLPEGSFFPGMKSVESSLEVLTLGASIGPSLPVLDRGRVSLLAGVAWGEMAMDPIDAESSTGLVLVRGRHTSFLDYSLAASVSWDVIDRWLSIGLQGAAAITETQDGELLHPAQASAPDGSLLTVDAMPDVTWTASGVLAVRVIL